MTIRHISQIIPEAMLALGVNTTTQREFVFPEEDEHIVKHEQCFNVPPLTKEEIDVLNYEMQNDLAEDERIWGECNVFDTSHPNGTKCQF